MVSKMFLHLIQAMKSPPFVFDVHVIKPMNIEQFCLKSQTNQDSRRFVTDRGR